MRFTAIVLALGVMAALAGCKEQEKSTSTSTSTTTSTSTAAPAATPTEHASMTPPAQAPNPSSANDTITTASGLKYLILKVGDGAIATKGMTAVVHYTGWLTNGTKFDSSVDRGQPFPVQLGAGRVIQGWEEGLDGMRVGEKRKLIIPPQLGYGAQGAGGVIPPDATLIFDVELLSVR